MKVIVTGGAGFVGSELLLSFRRERPDWELLGIDNFIRPGSELNRDRLRQAGIALRHADLRCQSDLDALPAADWVVDAAANASVIAGLEDDGGSRRLVEHNLGGTVNLLEYCRRRKAGFALLSTSRVYSIPPLAALPVRAVDGAYVPDLSGEIPAGLSEEGVDETFSTAPPVSLYGATKLCSEALALEYGAAFGFPVVVNRCGNLAGAGQFGRADQGIFAFWINAHLRKRPLAYIGFDGQGSQVRDCLHPHDLAALLLLQLAAPGAGPSLQNVSGGRGRAASLRHLTAWCDARFGAHAPAAEARPRPFDIPWMVLDSRRARRAWGWEPRRTLDDILSEIADHARQHPGWLELSQG